MPEGRTSPPLAAHGATMVIFLSAGMLEALSEELQREPIRRIPPRRWCIRPPGRRRRWSRCTVGALAQAGREHRISKTALVLVGDFLAHSYRRSLLYHPGFSTEYRQGRLSRGGPAMRGRAHRLHCPGNALAERLAAELTGAGCPAACTREGLRVEEWAARAFPGGRRPWSLWGRRASPSGP